MSLTNSDLQVTTAVNDVTTYYLDLQPTSSGLTNSVYVNPNLTFVPATSTVGLQGTINLNGLLLNNNSAEKRQLVTISNNTLSLDISAATLFEVTLNNNISLVAITNVQSLGRVSSFVLITTGDGTARAVTWPSSFKWPSGVAPTITSTSGKKDVFVFFTVDAGSNWQSFITGQNL